MSSCGANAGCCGYAIAVDQSGSQVAGVQGIHFSQRSRLHSFFSEGLSSTVSEFSKFDSCDGCGNNSVFVIFCPFLPMSHLIR